MTLLKDTQLRLLATRGFAFLCILFLVDFAVGGLMRKAYFSTWNKYTYGLVETTADIIIVGSSRAQNHYVPSVFYDNLGLTCYNMGSGGQNIYYDFGIVNAILGRYTPKIIIIDLMYIDYEVTNAKHNTDNLSIFLPYYRTINEIREVVHLRGSKERIKLLSSIYPFNSQATNIIFSTVKGDDNPHFILNGYIPLEGEILLPAKEIIQDVNSVPDSAKINFVKRIIKNCKKHNVRLILVKSPTFTGARESKLTQENISSIAKESGTNFWNYEQDSIFLSQKSLFKDELHLNHLGAEIFSSIIANRIRANKLH